MDVDATQFDEIAALMQDVRAFGRLPKEVHGPSETQIAERSLASRLRKSKLAGYLIAEHEAALTAMGGEVTFMLQIQALGFIPKHVKGTSET